MSGYLKLLPKELGVEPEEEQSWPKLEKFWCGVYANPDGATCCFWHWRGLPRRWGKRHPIYSWQQRVIDDLEAKVRYIYILKPPKLGATELFLSYGIWKAMTDPAWINGQVGILVGTNMQETEEMIARTKDILAVKDGEGRPIIDEDGNKQYRVPIHYSYNNKRQFTLNTVKFIAHPAGHYDAIRAKPNMRMIIGDEIAFFIKKREDETEIRSAFEHYNGGGDTIVALITTAGAAPAGFAYDIYKEEPSMYKKFILSKQDGLEIHPESGTSLLDPQAVEEKQKLSPATYKREYELQWGYDAGNILKAEEVDACIKEYDLEGYKGAINKMGFDPAWGSSVDAAKFGMCDVAIVDGKIRVYEAVEFGDMTHETAKEEAEWRVGRFNPEKIYVDGSNPVFVKSLKGLVNERVDYEQDKDHENWWTVKPLSPSTEDRTLTQNARELVSGGYVEVHPKFKELILQLRMARVDVNGKLDKKIHHLDTFDAFRHAVYGYRVNKT